MINWLFEECIESVVSTDIIKIITMSMADREHYLTLYICFMLVLFCTIIVKWKLYGKFWFDLLLICHVSYAYSPKIYPCAFFQSIALGTQEVSINSSSNLSGAICFFHEW